MMSPESGWRFFTDQVMGGLSTGGLVFAVEDGQSHARMTGHVSIANRGGFIQMRHDIARPPPPQATGVRLVVRGNGQRYFVHLHSQASVRPWQYHQAGFDVTEVWTVVHLPFATFVAQGGSGPLGPVTSVAIAAYGRDHAVLIDIRAVDFY